MMKFGGGGGFSAPSSMLIVLLLFFFMGAQISDAVQCIFTDHAERLKGLDPAAVARFLENEASEKSCDACASYICNGISGKMGYGCPEDFYRLCSGYSKAIDYVKSYNPLKGCYFDGTTAYISGCEKEANGILCLENNIVECNNMIKEAQKDGYGTAAWPYWNGSNGIEEGIWKLSGMILLGWILARFY